MAILVTLVTFPMSSIASSYSRGQFVTYDPTGRQLKTLNEHYDWNPEWTQIVPADIDGNGDDELIFYAATSSLADAGKALADIYDVSEKGEMTLIKRHKNWDSQWQQLIALDIDGDHNDELLFYSATSTLADPGRALADIYDVSSNGDLRLVRRHKNWDKLWARIVAADFNGDGDDEIILYSPTSPLANSGKALADFYDVSASGELKLIRRHQDWYREWQQIVPADIDGDGAAELVFYSSRTGTGANGTLGEIDDVSGAGEVRPLKMYQDWSAVWSEIVAADLDGDGDEELTFYARGASAPRTNFGLSQSFEIASNGGMRTLFSSERMNPRASAVLPVRLNRRSSALLLYSRSEGPVSDLTPFGYKARTGLEGHELFATGTHSLAWIVLNFPDGPQALNGNLNTTSVRTVAAYFAEVSQGRLSINNLPITGPINVTASCSLGLPMSNDDEGARYESAFRIFGIQQAVNSGFRIAGFDVAPRNRVVSDAELGVYISSNCKAGDSGDFAVTRAASGAIGGGLRYVGDVASGGAKANLRTIIHELTHVYADAGDLYGRQCQCGGATIMDATVSTLFNTPLYHPDPLHRLLAGWVEVRAFDLSKYPPTIADIALTRGSRPVPNAQTPLILFDSRRGTGEFLMVEFRRADPGSFDAGVADNGVAIWRIKKSPSGRFVNTGVSLVSPSGSRFWDATDGLVPLKWSDGSDLPVMMVAPAMDATRRSSSARVEFVFKD